MPMEHLGHTIIKDSWSKTIDAADKVSARPQANKQSSVHQVQLQIMIVPTNIYSQNDFKIIRYILAGYVALIRPDGGI